MSLSMTQLRAETLEHLGLDPEDLDDSGSANLDLLINRSWWDLISRLDFQEKEQRATFTTVGGTREYSLASILGSPIFESVATLSITDPNTLTHLPLNPISQGWYEENYNEQVSQRAQPTNYFHFNTKLVIFPTPDTTYTITIWYTYILTDLTAQNPTIPQEWHEAILYGAVQKGLIRARDYTAAQAMAQQKEITIASHSTQQAKDDKQMKMAGVQVYRNSYNVRK